MAPKRPYRDQESLEGKTYTFGIPTKEKQSKNTITRNKTMSYSLGYSFNYVSCNRHTDTT